MRTLFIVFFLVVSVLNHVVLADESTNRNDRETQMAERAILTSLVVAHNARSRFLCTESPYACLGVDQGEIGLALLGSQNKNDMLANLLRFRLDGSLAEDFQCYVLKRGKRIVPTIKSLNSAKLHAVCTAEVSQFVKNNSSIIDADVSNSVCADESFIIEQKNELLKSLAEGKKCNSEDF